MQYFNEGMIEQTKKQREKTLWIYSIFALIYILATVGLIVWFTTLPYKSPQILVVKLIHFPLTGIFVIFSFIYFAIKYKRVHCYYKSVKLMRDGTKEQGEGSFFEYNDQIEDKDGVDFKSLIFIEWNKYKKDYFERRVLVYNELPFPQIPQNAYVKFITVGNVLYEYEILDLADEQPDQEKTEVEGQDQPEHSEEQKIENEQPQQEVTEVEQAEDKENIKEDNV